MGQFSWLDCKTGCQILDDVEQDVYVLVPKEFGGGHIVEHCYDGYGNFGGCDIYELIADWNRTYLKEDHIFPHAIKRYYWIKMYKQHHPEYHEDIEFKAFEKDWWPAYSDMRLDKKGIEYVTGREYRTIGIDLACYDEDNEALPFPIKITYDPDAVYEECKPSLSDPNQGWLIEEDEEEEDW